ncbi:MAG TPA: phenylalanine--tRNA ligase subunit alpha [Terriglobales bacterium]|nr:phenylalanine--tRNA ligase subunit alpha [Terriglobales bacterium]
MYQVPKLTDYSPAALDKAVAEARLAVRDELREVKSDADLKKVRDRWRARKSGVLTQINDFWLKGAPAESKREAGQRVNELKSFVESAIDEYDKDIRQMASPLAREFERVDITLPGIRRPIGARHPVLQAMNDVISVFKSMGYSVEEGPEVETDYYNFEALNFPPDHPARDTQDTIFLAGQENKPARERLLLRTHTSPVQIRTMQKYPPPVRVVCPGKVHRHDTPDASHSPLFHQVEGLAVDTNITFCDLKGTLDHAMKALFGSSVKTRFYPSFFPFTEPSADVQISCPFCGGKGCRTCKQSGWIELLGCGMVDPNVFEFVRDNGYDPAKISGFAFGMGADRVAMLRYGIDDIQLLFQGDVRFLEQFA